MSSEKINIELIKALTSRDIISVRILNKPAELAKFAEPAEFTGPVEPARHDNRTWRRVRVIEFNEN